MSSSLYLVQTPLGCLAASVDEAGVLVLADLVGRDDGPEQIAALARVDGALYVAVFSHSPYEVFALRVIDGKPQHINHPDAVTAKGKPLIEECGALALRLASEQYPTWENEADAFRALLDQMIVGEA